MPKLKLIRFKKSLKNMPRVLARKSFLTFLGLFLVVLLLGLTVFYYSYIFLAEISDETINEEKILKLDAKSQQKVLEEWQKRNEKFLEADTKKYPDPFNVD